MRQMFMTEFLESDEYENEELAETIASVLKDPPEDEDYHYDPDEENGYEEDGPYDDEDNDERYYFDDEMY
jgi:hypothetical protein